MDIEEVVPMNKDASPIVIIGAGFAGLSAAIEAAKHHPVVVLEKMAAPGGNSIISDGGIAVPSTPQQKAAGIEDSPALMAEDILRAGGGYPDLVEKVTSEALEAFNFLKESGVEFSESVEKFGGHSVARCIAPKEALSGRIILKALEKRAVKMHIDLRRRAYASRLIKDNEGRVSAVEVTYHSNRTHRKDKARIHAENVIITTGGFGADAKLLSRLDASLEGVPTTNSPSASGDMLIEAERIGAELIDMDAIQLAPWTSPDEKGFGEGPSFGEYIAHPYGIAVDESGNRFVNERLDRKTVADAMLALSSPPVAIADKTAVQHSGKNLEKPLKKGIVKRCDTIEVLAEACNLPKSNLARTIGAYNAGVGKDGAPDAMPIDTPPFYAMRLKPKIHHTMGGIKIDVQARALGKEGALVPGLFAAGEAAGGVHGRNRLGGAAITDCIVMGRIAGGSATYQS